MEHFEERRRRRTQFGSISCWRRRVKGAGEEEKEEEDEIGG